MHTKPESAPNLSGVYESTFELTGLEKCNTEPVELKEAHEKLISTGFLLPLEIPYSPIRDKPLVLHVIRRKWMVAGTAGRCIRKTIAR